MITVSAEPAADIRLAISAGLTEVDSNVDFCEAERDDIEDMAESMDDVLGMVPRTTGGGLLLGAIGATLSFSAIVFVFEVGLELELELKSGLTLAFESATGVEEVEEDDCAGVVVVVVVVVLAGSVDGTVGLRRISVGVVSFDMVSLERCGRRGASCWPGTRAGGNGTKETVLRSGPADKGAGKAEGGGEISLGGGCRDRFENEAVLILGALIFSREGWFRVP